MSIKSSGHSYVGQSTAGNSIMIWMLNFPKDGEITEGYVDSCGTEHNVVGIGGGEIWQNVV